MNRYKTLLQNTGLFALNTFATKLITFLLVPLYTQYLTSGEYGITDMSTTVIGLVTPLVTLSVSDSMMRFALEDKGRAKKYITIGLGITVTSCVLVALLTPLLDLGVFGGLGRYKLLFVLAYAVNALELLFADIARATDAVRVIPVSSIAASVVTAVTAVVFIGAMRMSVIGYFYSVILGGAIGILLYIFVGGYHRLLTHVTIDELKSLLRILLCYSLPLIPNALFWWIGTSVNRFFITAMLGISASGLFAAAGKIPTMLNIICGVFHQAWQLSAFQEFRKSDISGYFSIIFRVFQAGMFVSASLVIALSPWLASLLLQKEFYQAKALIPVLVFAFFFNTMNSFFGTVYTASMKTRQLFTTTCMGSVIVVVGTWLLIPHFGLFGAGMANVMSNLAILVLRMNNSRRLIQVKIPWRYVVPSLILLSLQVYISSIESRLSGTGSWLFCLCITALQCICCLPAIKKVLFRKAQ